MFASNLITKQNDVYIKITSATKGDQVVYSFFMDMEDMEDMEV